MTVVQPEFDFKATDSDGKLVLEVKSYQGVGAIAVGSVISALALFVLVFTLIGGAYFFSVVAAIVAAVGIKYAVSRKLVRVMFDDKSLLADGKLYSLEHIQSIGFEGGGRTGPVLLDNTTAPLLNVQQMAGCYVYIIHGSKQIPIITGLTPHNVGQVYACIKAFLQKHGHGFAR